MTIAGNPEATRIPAATLYPGAALVAPPDSGWGQMPADTEANWFLFESPRPACRAYRSTVVTLAAATSGLTTLALDAESFDTAGMHSAGTDGVAMGGTVSTTSGSTSLIGSGTTFTFDYRVGMAVRLGAVGGVGVQTVVITAITDDTHATLATPANGTASGRAHMTVTSAVVFPEPGRYLLSATAYFDPVGDGDRELGVMVNGSGVASSTRRKANPGDGSVNHVAAAPDELSLSHTTTRARWDYVEVYVAWNDPAALVRSVRRCDLSAVYLSP